MSIDIAICNEKCIIIYIIKISKGVYTMTIKKFLSVAVATVIIISALGGCSGSEKKDVLVMATEATFPPYEYMDGNNIVGVDVDIAKAIAEELGMELKVENMYFDAVIPAVKSGKADFGAAGMSVTEERMKEVDFTVEYGTSMQVILTTQSSGIAAEADLNGKNVGVQLGTVADLVLTDDYPDVNLVRAKKYTDLAMELSTGKIDAIVLDSLPANQMAANNDGFVVIAEPLFTDVYAICVAKGNDELREKINTVLEKLMAEGKIAEFTNNHLQ